MKSAEASLPQGVDLPGSKSVHIIPSTADVKEEQSSSTTPLYALWHAQWQLSLHSWVFVQGNYLSSQLIFVSNSDIEKLLKAHMLTFENMWNRLSYAKHGNEWF